MHRRPGCLLVAFVSVGCTHDWGRVPLPILDASIAEDIIADRELSTDISPAIALPRPVFPLSMSVTSSQYVRLAWALGPGADGALYELFRDRACTVRVRSAIARGTTLTLATPLTEPGVYYWRLTGTRGGTIGTQRSPVWAFVVRSRSTPIASAFAAPLDVNGDGLADVAVGAPNAAFVGRVYVYHGRPEGIAAAPSATLEAPSPEDRGFGTVDGVGDVNGDGFGDLVVGAPTTRGLTGRVYVYHGGPDGIATTPATTIDGLDGANAAFGGRVTGLGDVNGDGYADVAISTPQKVNGNFGGGVYVFHGGPSGLGASPATTIDPSGPRAIELGNALREAGDLDNDGFADFFTGEGGWAAYHGRALVFHGSAAGLRTVPTTVVVQYAHSFGARLAGAMDINGDGHPDMIGAMLGTAPAGERLLVFAGTPTGIPVTATQTIPTFDPPNSEFGGGAECVGDIDGDGYDDVAIGSRSYQRGLGRVRLFRGGPGGLSTVASVVWESPAGAGGHFGTIPTGIGDVNGDLADDVAVTAPDAESNSGVVCIYHGARGELPLAVPSTILRAPAGGNFGQSIAKR